MICDFIQNVYITNFNTTVPHFVLNFVLRRIYCNYTVKPV